MQHSTPAQYLSSSTPAQYTSSTVQQHSSNTAAAAQHCSSSSRDESGVADRKMSCPVANQYFNNSFQYLCNILQYFNNSFKYFNNSFKYFYTILQYFNNSLWYSNTSRAVSKNGCNTGSPGEWNGQQSGMAKQSLWYFNNRLHSDTMPSGAAKPR